MPGTFTFECLDCGELFDDYVSRETSVSDEPCPKCGSAKNKKGFAPPAIILGNVESLTPLTEQRLRENSKWYSDRADQIRSGEIECIMPKKRHREFDPDFTKVLH